MKKKNFEFSMNNRIWEVKEISQEEIREHIIEYKYDGEPGAGKYYGQTYFDEQTIYIDKDLIFGQKMQTLLHELMHCYIGCYLFAKEGEYTEEELCNISANSHIIIDGIFQKYVEYKIKTKGIDNK